MLSSSVINSLNAAFRQLIQTFAAWHAAVSDV
jgi:hypothetical protein